MELKMNVAVLGASNKPNRYSYKAVKMLLEKGHTVFPVHPAIENIEGLPVYQSLKKVSEDIDTITVYLSAARSDRITNEILEKGVQRVIFNPGAENPFLSAQLKIDNVEVVDACTLVMLATGQF